MAASLGGIMQSAWRSIGKELGTAFAVLAMYLLLILAPWHQASGLQHDLAELGYASLSVVDICGPVGETPDGQGSAELKCHIAGIGKFDALVFEPGSIALQPRPATQPVVYAYDSEAPRASISPHTGQARAPPVTV